MTDSDSVKKNAQETNGYDTTSIIRPSRFKIAYLGCLALHKKVTRSMLKWVLVEIKLSKKDQLGYMSIQGASMKLHSQTDTSNVILSHNVHGIFEFSCCQTDPRCFFYLHQDSPQSPVTMFAFSSNQPLNQVNDVFEAIQRAAKTSNKPPSMSLKRPLSHNTKTFEVKYQGRTYIAEKKKSGAFIDTWLKEKSQLNQQENDEGRESRGNSYLELLSHRSRHASAGSISSIDTNTSTSTQTSSTISSINSRRDSRVRTCSEGDEGSPRSRRSIDDQDSINSHHSINRLDSGISDGGGRVGSIVSASSAISDIFDDVDERDGRRKTLITIEDLNKTMLMQVDDDKMSVISLDRKSIILEKTFVEISYCTQGVNNPDHFGIISVDVLAKKKEEKNHYVLYIFQCASSAVASELMETLKRAFNQAAKRNQEKQSCEVCPMSQYNKLCEDISPIKDSETLYNCIQTHIQNLSTSDYTELMNKVQTEQCQSYPEANDVLMTKLRIMCELKQLDHQHRSKVAPVFNLSLHRQSKMNVFRNKARKALTHQEWKPATRNEDGLGSPNRQFETSSPVQSPRSKLVSFNSLTDRFSSRPRSQTLPAVPDISLLDNGSITSDDSTLETSQKADNPTETGSSSSGTGILQRLSNMGQSLEEAFKSPDKPTPTNQNRQSSSPLPADRLPPLENVSPMSQNATHKMNRRGSSWRREIFDSVVTMPSRNSQRRSAIGSLAGKLSSDEIRARWRCAIEQTMVLNRMDRENRNIKNDEERRKVKAHLSYTEVPVSDHAKTKWKSLLGKVSQNTERRTSSDEFWSLIREGVPRGKRGDIWSILARQYRRSSSPGIQDEINPPDIPDYKTLLEALTPHQHDILIDLGRTFPQHPYFKSQLGAGQLAMFNVLKAYALVDGEVGYCQGLAFVTGILLMHVSEKECFRLLIHLMYNLGLRRLYKLDMSGLQVALYQLLRLLRDKCPDLYEHLEQLEIKPTLYAASWFMTLFSSEFSIGFASRVFDYLFMEGYSALFKVSLALLMVHKELILAADSFESVTHILKRVLPDMEIMQMEKIFTTAGTIDLGFELYTYQIEYHVFREDNSANAFNSVQTSENIEENYRKTIAGLQQTNIRLVEQISTQQHKLYTQEATIDALKQSYFKMTSRIHQLEEENRAQQELIENLRKPAESLTQLETKLTISDKLTTQGC